MSGQWGLLLMLLAGGLLGGFLIGRNATGLRALGAFLLWLSVPFVILAFVLSASIDPTLEPERASYNFAFGFVLMSLLMAILWLPANLVGGIVGRSYRARRPEAPANAAAAAPVDPELPDWSRADNPPLSLAELGQRMHAIADRAGIRRELLPGVGPVTTREGSFLDRDKFDYIYIGLERGIPMFDRRTVVADRLLYHVFSDAAFGLALHQLIDEGTSPYDRDDLLEQRRQAILAGIDPRWGKQYALERNRQAGA